MTKCEMDFRPVEVCLDTSRRDIAGWDTEMVMEYTIGIGQVRSATGAYLRQVSAGETNVLAMGSKPSDSAVLRMASAR